MPKTTTAKTTKTATKAVVDKKTKPKADETKPKEKREPTAWDKFRKEETKRLKDNEPGLDAETRRKQVSETWLNHVDNPNRGKPRKPRAPKKKDAENGERPEREPATDSSSLPPSSPMTSSP